MAGRESAVLYMATAALVLCVWSLWLEAGEAATDCTTALAGVAGCAAFLTNPKSTPDQTGCCDPLKTVLSTPATFQCLCAQASNSDSQAFKNALLLPQACKLSINVSQANCTSSTATPPATKTPATPTTPASSSNSNAGHRDGSAGVISASPVSPFLALALLGSIVSCFV